MGCRAWGCGGHGQVWGHGGMTTWRPAGESEATDQALAGRAGRHDCLPAPCPRRTPAHRENPLS
jgi:hypothetical protein